jgi:predicted lipoprotein with Yx(FWY)xxD motif
MLGTITRDDGGRQVTYAGVPLYYYAGDGGKPDETSGEGIEQFGAAWYLVSPKNGAPVEFGNGGGGS